MTVTSPPHDGLTFASFRADDLGEVTPAQRDGWLEAHSRGFHKGRNNDEMRKHYFEHAVSDDALLRGVWQVRPLVGSGKLPIATFGSFDKTLNVGGNRLLPLRMITDVTVSPTHRRQGLLRRLMTQDLQEAVDQGLPLAALTVSEGSIYGRFGFGLATQLRHLEVDTSARFVLRGLDDEGSIELVEPEEAWPTVESVFAEFHRRTRGSVERPLFYRPILSGTFDYRDGPDTLLRAAVHLDAAGRPDGYVIYKPGERRDDSRAIEVKDLVALTSQAYLRIWRFLADIDLATKVTWQDAPVADPLEWALVDPFVAKVVKTTDQLWVRVLDVVAALEARPWAADGDVVLEVADPLGHAAGRFRVTTSAGQAKVSRTDDEPDVLLEADTLGALYLGGVGVATLRAAGRVTGSDEGVTTWAAMADTGPPPYCITGF
ncbi:MAG: GNAT family N-acetyltransferase [Actinomycetota bacterium]|nr:GNAT family N-acetyltransferase [Actinomycetota bacterium]